MNYKKALMSNISMNVSKKDLVEIGQALQDEALLNELKEPGGLKLIGKGINLLAARIKYEVPLLIKDVVWLGSKSKEAVIGAINSDTF